MIQLSKKHNNVQKNKLKIRSFDKLLVSTKAHCQGCQIAYNVDIDQTRQPSLT